MNLQALLPAFAQHLAARAAAARTIASYVRTVEAFFETTGDDARVRTAVEAFLARVGRGGSQRGASTKRAELIALRAFFRFAAPYGVADPTAGMAVKRERKPNPAVLMPSEVAPMFEAALRSGAPARNVMVVALLQVIGLRVHELVALDVEQLDLVARVLRRVRGKGGTVADLPLPDALVAIASSWLRQRAMLGHHGGPLLPSARPRRCPAGRLSIRSLQRLVNRLALDAGLERRLGPHALRHGCATAAISLGVDVPTTAEVMRHSSINTTQAYVHLARDARREAVERLASLIPASAVPAVGARIHGGNDHAVGGRAAVDIHPAMDAIGVDVPDRADSVAEDADEDELRAA